METKMIFHQLYESETSTYTYLLGDPVTKEAVLIDPVLEMVKRDVTLVEELGLKLKYVLETHVHADHISASGQIRNLTGAKVCYSSSYDMACADLHLDDGQEIKFGDRTIRAIHTPGHTSGCMSYQTGDMVFTGDALLIRGCGRTDFQEGSSETLFRSVREKLFRLPDETLVYPGHDYKGLTHSSIGTEKKFNPRLSLSKTREDFLEIMANLKLAYPKKIQESVPANLQCGLPAKGALLPVSPGEVANVRPQDVYPTVGHFRIIDVRGADEFNGELGHISSAELATLGPELEKFLESENPMKEIIFVCRSGRRSAEATKLAQLKGFKHANNLEGGMLKWNELRYPIVRDLGGS